MNNQNINEEEKVSRSGNLKASFTGRKFRSGAYVTILSTIVVVIVLVVNMLVSSMKIEFDLSSKNMYTLTQASKDLIKSIKDDITIYYMVESGQEQEIFSKIVDKYNALSGNIKVEYKDPLLYPGFASDYTDKDVTENSLIVVNNTNGKSKYIDSNDMLVQEMDYQTYQTKLTGIDVEGEITSALQFVTSDKTAVLYTVEGHGETAAGAVFNETLSKMNIEIKSLQTLSVESIPEDCKVLYINTPTTDFTEEETSMIKDYLTGGGNVIVTLNYKSAELKNFASILDYYGLKMVDGIVFEGNANMRSGSQPVVLLPNIESSDITSQAKGASNIPVVMAQCSGILATDTTRSTLVLTPLLTTSDSAYAKTNYNTTIEKQTGDVEGPFNLGILSSDTYNGTTSNLVAFATDYTFEDSMLSYGNGDILSGTAGYFIGDTNAISIPTKSLEEDIIYTTGQDVAIWGIVIVIVIPVAVLAIGILVSLRRRKR